MDPLCCFLFSSLPLSLPFLLFFLYRKSITFSENCIRKSQLVCGLRFTATNWVGPARCSGKNLYPWLQYQDSSWFGSTRSCATPEPCSLPSRHLRGTESLSVQSLLRPGGVLPIVGAAGPTTAGTAPSVNSSFIFWLQTYFTFIKVQSSSQETVGEGLLLIIMKRSRSA